MQVGFLDHYDSFSFNLIDWLFSDTGLEIVYFPFDTDGLCEKMRTWNKPIVISPGPKDPLSLPETMEILRDNLGKVPILGICLGHQCLGVQLGASIGLATNPFHGTSQSLTQLRANSLVANIPNSAQVARYNSLVLKRGSLDENLITAINLAGDIEAIEWHGGKFPAFGLQFHPESFLSSEMSGLKAAWVRVVRDFYCALGE